MRDEDYTTNRNFHDLDPEERAYWYEKAREDTGQNFFDLDPEERGRYYDRATRRE
jgi:hypothetical protein